MAGMLDETGEADPRGTAAWLLAATGVEAAAGAVTGAAPVADWTLHACSIAHRTATAAR